MMISRRKTLRIISKVLPDEEKNGDEINEEEDIGVGFQYAKRIVDFNDTSTWVVSTDLFGMPKRPQQETTLKNSEQSDEEDNPVEKTTLEENVQDTPSPDVEVHMYTLAFNLHNIDEAIDT
ncbi:hypothetical protein V6N11_014321 [Hibiscus sabdariffa]